MTYYNHTADDVLEELGTTEKGLLSSEAAVRLQSYGKTFWKKGKSFPAQKFNRPVKLSGPLARIDHVFVGPGIDVASIEVPNTELTMVASNHLPLIVDIFIPRR